MKLTKFVVCGQKKVGKTLFALQLASPGTVPSTYIPTVEDTFTVLVDTDKGTREMVVLVDTAGCDAAFPDVNRQYFSSGDAFILMYSVDDSESFNRVDSLKRDIEKNFKERRETPLIVVVGNKSDLEDKRVVDKDFAINWAQREKVKLVEISALKRDGISEPITYLASKLFSPQQKEAKFTISKRNKDRPPGTALVMDI